MTEPNENAASVTPSTEILVARERTKQAGVAGWTAGLSAFFAMVTAGAQPTWPVAAAITAIAAMIAVTCYLMLRR
jgi:hypothetical protein